MLDKQQFLSKYNLQKVYNESKISWDILNAIYEDYKKSYGDLKKIAKNLVAELEKEEDLYEQTEQDKGRIQAVYGRAKDAEHLVAKIIRKICKEDIEKYRKINVNNYKTIITDLIGIRMLVLSKEEWLHADSIIRKVFEQKDFVKQPKAYVCYGDRQIFDERLIQVDYTNKGYRSQHYIVSYQGVSAEIQVRTLSEEVYGEFDHRIRYPYNESNRFLLRYTKIISKNIAQLDDLISTCLNIGDDLLNKLGEQFEKDTYVNWSKENMQKVEKPFEQDKTLDSDIKDLKQRANNKIFAR